MLRVIKFQIEQVIFNRIPSAFKHVRIKTSQAMQLLRIYCTFKS